MTDVGTLLIGKPKVTNLRGPCLAPTTLLSLATFILASPSAKATESAIEISCPPVLATRVIAQRHRGWLIYSNNPLRLTAANIAFDGEHDGGWLEPDETKHLSDENLSVVSSFRLAEHRDLARPSLVCHYGVHAQLSRNLPSGATECKVIKHLRFGANEYEFEASCR